MQNLRFGTAINCIDGRVQEAVTRWVKDAYHLDYVDLVTEPGADKILSQGSKEALAEIRAKVYTSISAHGSSVVVIAGHYDCAANPVSQEEHLRQIRNSMQVIRFWNFPVTVVGLWVNENWAVEVVGG